MTNDQQLRTVFVSRIPELMDDATARGLFQLIPSFETFVRLLNGRSEPLSYGFVRFQSVDAVKVFIDTFSAINYKANTNGTFDSLFSATPEENTVRYLEHRLEENGKDYLYPFMGKNLKDLTAMASVKVKSWYDITASTYGDNISIKIQSDHKDSDDNDKQGDDDLDMTALEDVNINESEFDDLELDDKDVILQEIREFRLLSMKFEKVKQDQSAEEKKERDKYLEKETSKMLANQSERGASKRRGEDNKLFTELDFQQMSDSEESSSESDERLEEIRQARLRQKEERAFEEDQRRWIGRERIRTSALAREKEREEGSEARMDRERRKALKQYAEFVDGDDYESKKMEYYFNHATWAKNRMTFRRRELAADQQDADEEAEELQQKTERKNNFMSSLASELSSKKPSTGKFTLSLSGPKKQSDADAKDAVDETTKSKVEKKPKRLEFAVNYETLRDIEDFKSLSSGDHSISALVDEIPKSSEELFTKEISWEFLTDDIIEDKLKPFITSLIMEYLGIQEDELISFVLSLLKEHKQPQLFLSELEMTLDEDAIVFTQQLWRLLIFETERQRRDI